MYVKPTTPRSIGGVFDDAIRMWRNFGPGVWLLACALELATAVPSLVWQMRVMPRVADSIQDPLAALEDPLTASQNSLAALHVPSSVWLLTLLGIATYLVFYVALIVSINGVASARTVSTGAAIGCGIKKLPSAVLLGVLIVCIVLLGLLLLLVPGLYWAGTLSLAFIALGVEDTGVSQSMAVSRGLIKGHWWRAATLISYIFLIASVAYLVVLLVNGLIFLGLGAAGPATTVVSQVIGVAVGTLLTPLYFAVYVALYYDLKLRKAAAGSAG
jgi:hypothetical protein